MESCEAKRMLNLLVELPHSTYTGMDFGCASFSPGSLARGHRHVSRRIPLGTTGDRHSLQMVTQRMVVVVNLAGLIRD